MVFKGNIPYNKIPKWKIDKIRRLYQQGYKLEEIEKITNVSVPCIYHKVQDIRENKRLRDVRIFSKRLHNLSEYDRGYIAGFFDGEGSIIIQRTSYRNDKLYYMGSLIFSNQDLRILKYIHKKLNLWVKIGFYKSNGETYSMGIWGKEMLPEFLKFLLEYSQSEKTKKRAKILLKFCKTKDKKEQRRLFLLLKNTTIRGNDWRR